MTQTLPQPFTQVVEGATVSCPRSNGPRTAVWKRVRHRQVVHAVTVHASVDDTRSPGVVHAVTVHAQEHVFPGRYAVTIHAVRSNGPRNALFPQRSEKSSIVVDQVP